MADAFVVSAPALAFVCFMVFLAGFVDASAGGGGIIAIPAYLFTGDAGALRAREQQTFERLRDYALSYKILAQRRGRAAFRGDRLRGVVRRLGARRAHRAASERRRDKKSLLVILPCVALVVLFKRNFGEEGRAREISRVRAALLSAVIGVLIGGYDGLFGPGTGTFAIIAFSMLLGLDLKTSSGNAKILNVASNYASLITFICADAVVFSIAIPAALCNMAGNYLGSRCALAKGARFIRPMMLCVLSMLMMKFSGTCCTDSGRAPAFTS